MTDQEWWGPYMPRFDETWQDYIRRATGFDREFVMMEHEPNDIDIIGRAHQLLVTRHTFVPGVYCCFVIRDLVFLAYSKEYADGSW